MLAFFSFLPSVPTGYEPFAISLLVMGVIFLVEMITIIMGVGIFSFLDALLPDVDMPSGSMLNWFRAGKAPLGMVLVVLLTAFGVIGIALQSLLMNFLGFVLPTWIAVCATLLLSIYPVRWGSRFIGWIMPSTETDAISSDAFIGNEAEIVIGTAEYGRPAPAKFYDYAGTRHDVQVEPSVKGLSFKKGDKVLLVSKKGSTFLADPQF